GDRNPDRRPDRRPDRPVIGHGDFSRPAIVDNRWSNNNVKFNNWNNWNRPGWDHGWNRPGWGWGGWGNNWHNDCINPHYGWYNGRWISDGRSNWYAPLAWGAVGWGLGSITSGWGYVTSYYNPYYVQAAAVPYDCSRPVVVNTYYDNS